MTFLWPDTHERVDDVAAEGDGGGVVDGADGFAASQRLAEGALHARRVAVQALVELGRELVGQLSDRPRVKVSD